MFDVTQSKSPGQCKECQPKLRCSRMSYMVKHEELCADVTVSHVPKNFRQVRFSVPIRTNLCAASTTTLPVHEPEQLSYQVRGRMSSFLHAPVQLLAKLGLEVWPCHLLVIPVLHPQRPVLFVLIARAPCRVRREVLEMVLLSR